FMDFGCGCGRVLRHVLKKSGATNIYACDVNANAIRWCSKKIRGVVFLTNSLLPPMDLAPQSVDLIYAFSVFTHLPTNAQQQWISELNRILTGGGKIDFIDARRSIH